MSTLHIEGDLAAARLEPTGRACIRTVRQALVTGGRALLDRVPGRPRYGFALDDTTVTFRLNPEIEHRIRTSGGMLTDEEIMLGLEQLRESEEDMEVRVQTETERALVAGITFAREQFEKALTEGDERALHQAWEMARKTFTLRKRLARMAAAPVSVATEAAPTDHQQDD